MIRTGIPEIDVPPVEPLNINKLYMENGHGPVRVRAAFNNVTALGASNYSINSVRCVYTLSFLKRLLRFSALVG